MTRTAAAKRRIAIASSALAAFALLAGMATTTTATAGDVAQGSTMAAKARDAKTTRPAKVKAAAQVRTVEAPATDFTSIFASQLPAYTNSGWATCPAAISWNVDTTGLTEVQATRQLANLEYAFAQWTAASGLTFTLRRVARPRGQRDVLRGHAGRRLRGPVAPHQPGLPR